jgi:hypothetical protein
VLVEEGLFRVSGSVSEIKQLFERFQGVTAFTARLDDVLDPATVTGILRAVIRESGKPLSPREALDLELAFGNGGAGSEEEQCTAITEVLDRQVDTHGVFARDMFPCQPQSHLTNRARVPFRVPAHRCSVFSGAFFRVCAVRLVPASPHLARAATNHPGLFKCV